MELALLVDQGTSITVLPPVLCHVPVKMVTVDRRSVLLISVGAAS